MYVIAPFLPHLTSPFLHTPLSYTMYVIVPFSPPHPSYSQCTCLFSFHPTSLLFTMFVTVPFPPHAPLINNVCDCPFPLHTHLINNVCDCPFPPHTHLINNVCDCPHLRWRIWTGLSPVRGWQLDNGERHKVKLKRNNSGFERFFKKSCSWYF